MDTAAGERYGFYNFEGFADGFTDPFREQLSIEAHCDWNKDCREAGQDLRQEA